MSKVKPEPASLSEDEQVDDPAAYASSVELPADTSRQSAPESGQAFKNLVSEAPATAAPVPAVAPVAAPSLTPPAPAPAPADGWQSALYTQQMAHQLALAELRNQHLQEQQRMMQQMLDLMQRQLR
ncbi:hypothetical protein HER32_01460 [Hymenobacter sp. BT18]|uniref:hypothetical protein n=1 Tax=Hymenobacter sp. BT18 TaxID=2835648 RepID=UPI00143EC9B9|nr:hypothetical protein [Hymenobacter sp. BT18]QIX59654.1 hypothetical protein HER32_01460 [Hymenobacter sp. BT18]